MSANLSFYGDPAKKAARVARAVAHAEADRLISGTYVDGSNYRGCSVGCDLIDIYGGDLAVGERHARLAVHDGTPEWLERLRDSIFEGLSAEKRAWWHVALARAIPVGVDLTPHYHLISIEILKIALENCGNFDPAIRAVASVIDLHKSAAWSAARSAAESAAWSAESAARSAARSAAWSAESAAWSAAESAAWSAARSAARSAAESAAWSAAWGKIAIAVIAILEATP